MGMVAYRREGIRVVEVSGPRLDAATVDAFKVEIKGMIDSGERRILLDFNDVQFMDSSGLGGVVGCLKYMGPDGTIEIARPADAVLKVLKLTRMTKVFSIRDLPGPG